MAMTPEEQTEYLGLAATVGRLMASLKQVETQLAEQLAKPEDPKDQENPK